MKFTKITLLGTALLATLAINSCSKKDSNVSPGYTYQFIEDFNADNNKWSFSDPSNNSSVTVSQGQLYYYYYPSGTATKTQTVAKEVGLNVGGDFDIQTSISTDNTMGLTFGVSSSDNGYAFMIDANGNFSLYYEGSSSSSPLALKEWQPSSAIKTDNSWNKLEIQQAGTSWIGYINNVQVFNIRAYTLGGAQIGFIVEANSAGGTDGYADNLYAYWM